MKESIFYVCFIVTSIISCATWFCFNNKIDYFKTVRLEKEFYEYAKNISFYNEAISRANEVMQILPVSRLEYEGARPVKAYLINGEEKNIQWAN